MKIQRLIEHLKAKGQWTSDLKIKVLDKSCGVVTESTASIGTGANSGYLSPNCGQTKILNESLEKPVHSWGIRDGVLTVKTFED